LPTARRWSPLITTAPAGNLLPLTAGTLASTGRILDEDGAALAGASIVIPELHREAVSQGNGEFVLSGVGPGVHDRGEAAGLLHQSRQITVGLHRARGVTSRSGDPLKLEAWS